MFIMGLLVLLSNCSTGLRMKNLMNVPFALSSLSALDTMKIQPDVIKYVGPGESQSRRFKKDIRIQGNHGERPLWRADGAGCFKVSQGATIHILDFNFDGTQAKSGSIEIDSGMVFFENCDFSRGFGSMIRVGRGGRVELKNCVFRDIDRVSIQLDGGIAIVRNSDFIRAGESAILANSAKLVELHQTKVESSLNTGIKLKNVREVWLDSTSVLGSFQDGVSLTDCDYAFISQVILAENGQHGLRVQGGQILGLLEVRSLGNLVNGMDLTDLDSLRMVGSEFVGNGGDGANLFNVRQARMTSLHFGHNAGTGLLMTGGGAIRMDRTRIQGNPDAGGQFEAVDTVSINQSQIVNNGTGINISNSVDLRSSGNLFFSNKKMGLMVSRGQKTTLVRDQYTENQIGFKLTDVLNLQLDSCRIMENTQGSDLRSIAQITMQENRWQKNIAAAFFVDIGDLMSQGDAWFGSASKGIEILSGAEFRFIGSNLVGNHDAVTYNQTALSFETCRFDSGTGVSLKGSNASLSITDSRFHHNTTVVDLQQGCRAEFIQSDFQHNGSILTAGDEAHLLFSFCNVHAARKGIQLGNYAELTMLSSQFSELDDFVIRIGGPFLQEIFLRQNVIHHSGGILDSKRAQGTINLTNNTFAENLDGLQLHPDAKLALHQNIFYHTNVDDLLGGLNLDDMRWNCFTPDSRMSEPDNDAETNIYADPQLGAGYFLNPGSLCLIGGENGALIGARGLNPIKPPVLAP